MNPEVNARLTALSTGAKIIAGCLVLSFITLFLPWWTASAGPYSASQNAFYGWGWAYALFWLITTAFFVITVFELNVNLPGLPLVNWELYIIGGVVMLFTGLLFYTSVPSLSYPGVSWGVSFGWWLALIAAAGVIAGGWLSRPTGATFSFRTSGLSGSPIGGSPGYAPSQSPGAGTSTAVPPSSPAPSPSAPSPSAPSPSAPSPSTPSPSAPAASETPIESPAEPVEPEPPTSAEPGSEPAT